MCVSPKQILQDGQTFSVDCGTCWQCRKDRINDYVGRCVAESRTAKATYALTLTYGDHMGVNASVLVYRDVQLFLKLVRKKYGKLRYIVTGEYSTGKARAHYHIILFFYAKIPDWGKIAERSKKDLIEAQKFELAEYSNNERFDWVECWQTDGKPNGFVYLQRPDWGGMKYALKYILKDQYSDSNESHLAMSKKPPLGHDYFMDLADQHVQQGLAPQTYGYKFDEMRNKRGKRYKLKMQGKTRDNFMERILTGWRAKYGFCRTPNSELFDEWMDKRTRKQNNNVIKKEYKPVKYIQPEILRTNKPNFTDAEMIELQTDAQVIVIYNYQGVFEITQKIDQWQHGHFFKGDIVKWREDDPEIQKAMLAKGKVIRREKLGNLLAQELQ